MSAALPAPWIDCGLSASVDASGTLAFHRFWLGNFLQIGNVLIARSGVFLDPNIYWHVPGQTPVAFESGSSGFTAAFSWSRLAGPYRLGARMTTHPTTGDAMLQYAFFADADTVYTETFAGTTQTVATWTTPTLVGDLDWVAVGYEGYSNSGSTIVASWRDLAVRSVPVDTTGLGAGVPFATVPPAGIDAVGRTDSSPFVGRFQSFGDPVRFRLDADVLDAGGASLGATIALPYPVGGTATAPYNQVITGARASWDPTPPSSWDEIVSLDLDGTWRGAQDPPVPSSEQHVWFRGQIPMNPRSSPSSWNPATITLAARRNILLSTNNWSGSGSVALSGAGNSVWNVSGAGASVSRTLLEKWRNWTTVADPLFRADGFRITRHDYDPAAAGQDVWGWGTYGYLELILTAPSSGNLTLVVAGKLAAFTYLTGAKTGETAYTATYTVPVVSGANTVTVDLLFPDSWTVADGIPSSGTGGPWYHERVDSLTISGFATGVYTLTGCALVAKSDGYLKLDYSNDLAGCVLAVDGSFPMGLWAANPQDPPVTGNFLKNEEAWIDASTGSQGRGGAVPWQELVAAGNIQPRTYGELLEDLNRIEGITIAYDSTGEHAAIRDAFGVTLSGAHADWLHPRMPALRLPPGVATPIPASVYCRHVQLTNYPCSADNPLFRLWARPILGGVLEGIAVDGSSKRLPGGAVNAQRTDTSAVVATSFGDEQGFVSVPVGANASRGYRLVGA
jgi:hypothetical protein